MRNLILPLALTAGFALPAAAQWPAPVERQLSRSYNECMNTGDAAAGVTSGMMSCNGEEIIAQDARLNQAYRMVMARQSAAGKIRLRNLQRAWIPRRDRTCKVEADRDGGGTLSGLTYSSCTLRETIARRLWLERYR